ncbi:hypothetical protein [Williamsia sp. CHRR-6]|uniref:hypothetical protein n=1 Tax=Williamsia sp. CHRR-6 TaxID=2835871 RepID=UPI001BDA732A|nr:hypothetical protein [Williamsia sp. CHRR-6]MBT0567328.1 hypothetical protein [Williamsia sp. CHRR-6]
MNTPARGITRARITASTLAVGALAAVGITSGLAYADTHKDSTPASSTTDQGGSTSTGSSDGDSSGSSSSDTSSGDTSWGTAPTVSPGSGDSHAQSNGS